MEMYISKKVRELAGSKVSELMMKAAEEGWNDVIGMAGGEPLFNPPANSLQDMKQSFVSGVNRYPSFGGNKELKSLILNKFLQENIDIEQNQIYVVPGGASAIYNTLLTVLDNGDEILIQDPSWEHYPNIVKLAGGVPVQFEMTKMGSHYAFDWDDIISKINQNTKAILINSPLNPCGSVISEKEINTLIEITQNKNLWLIIDYEYEDYIYNGRNILLDGKYSNVICLHSFSKGFALTGIRLAYVVAENKFIEELHKSALYSFMYPTNISECIASNVLKGDYVEYLHKSNDFMKKKTKYLHKRLLEIPLLSCDLPEGGLYLFVSVKQLGISGIEFCKRLLVNRHLIAVPGEGSGKNGENMIRIFVGLDQEVLDEAVNRLKLEVKCIEGEKVEAF